MKNNLNFDPFRFWVQFFVIVLFSVTSYSQVFQTLPLADTNFSRFEDIYFVNESTGFVLNYDNDLYKTTNKGILWTRSFVIGGTQGRCIGMFDANTGIMGADNYPYVLFKTFDGGSHWTDIQGSIPLSLPPTGVKAISIVNSTTAIACCPNLIIKTTNSGESWSVSYVTNSPFLLDCKFWSADSGFVAGSTLMFTSNGGITWKQVYQKQGAIFRNLQFVNRQLGFCTVDYSSQPYVIKTTNGGENWSVLNLPQGIVGSISGGIGFMNEQVGWIGGYHHMNPLPCYRTTNGGINWEPAGWGTNLRRFQFVNDSIIYAVGKAVYKFQADTFIDPMCIPQLLSPANGSFDMPLSFRLDWSDVLPSATYDVQISKTPAFTTTVFNRTGVGQSHSFIPVSEHNLILKPFTRYFWRARSNTSAGLSAWSVVWEFTTGADSESSADNTHEGTQIPKEYKLYNNHPNPFNPSTNIKFDIPDDAEVNITVYDMLGREVNVLIDEFKQAGSYEVSFDASYLSSGMYFYKLTSAGFTDIKKMVLIK